MKTIYHILFSLLFVLAFVGCDDDDDKVIERNQLKLTASAQSVTLTPDATDDEIISFSWNEATSLGADYTFSYLFQIDIADNNFQSATDVRTFGPNESISYSSAELYDLIVEKWGKTAGEAVYVEARVAAKVEGPKFKYPEIATTKVQITTYKPTSQPLYITGTATTGGTDLNAAGMNTIVGYVYDMLYGSSGGYPSYASAAAILLFAIVLTITCINLLISRKHVHYI